MDSPYGYRKNVTPDTIKLKPPNTVPATPTTVKAAEMIAWSLKSCPIGPNIEINPAMNNTAAIISWEYMFSSDIYHLENTSPKMNVTPMMNAQKPQRHNFFTVNSPFVV